MILYCVFAGIQKHVVVTALATGFGKVVGNWYNQYMADRDSILRHYIELHPEDFPTPGKLSYSSADYSICYNMNNNYFAERKTFGEIMQRWVPIR